MIVTPDTWDVYCIRLPQYSNKLKFVVIVGINGSQYGTFTINTDRIKNPELSACDILIDEENHSFLDYDSYINVSGTFSQGALCYVPAAEIDNQSRVGIISDTCRPDVIEGVKSCSVLLPKTLKFILNCLESKLTVDLQDLS